MSATSRPADRSIRDTGKDELASMVAAGLLDLSAFWPPEYLCESAWLAHAPFLFWLIGRVRPSTFVELGSHNGFSYLAACQAVDRHATSTKCYAIDTWQGDEHSGLYGEEVLQRLSAYHDRRYSGFSSLVRATFDDAVRHFEDGSIDLLHVDGRHFYEDVRHDLETWLPKMSRHGLVLLHDTNVRERGFGIARYFAEIRGAHQAFEFRHGHGLGVVQAGDQMCAEIGTLLALDDGSDAAATVRAVYARLGDTVDHLWRAQAAETALAEQAALAKRLGESFNERSATVERLETALAEQAALAKRLGESFNERSAVVERLGAVVEEQSTTIERLEFALAMASQPPYRGLRNVVRHPSSWRTAVKAVMRSRRDHSLVTATPLFDAAWYRERYPDVNDAGVDPVSHYLRSGAMEGRDPGPTFSTMGYVTRYPDVARSGFNPLVHYLRFGAVEGRAVRPLEPH